MQTSWDWRRLWVVTSSIWFRPRSTDLSSIFLLLPYQIFFFRIHWENVSLILLTSHQSCSKSSSTTRRLNAISPKMDNNSLLPSTSSSAPSTPSWTRPWRTPWPRWRCTRQPGWSMTRTGLILSSTRKLATLRSIRWGWRRPRWGSTRRSWSLRSYDPMFRSSWSFWMTIG